MRALILAFLLLLPSLAVAQDITAGKVTLGGKTYTVIFRPEEVTPPPPPPPVRRSVYGVQLADGTWTREARSGDILTLRGEGLGLVPGQVWTAGIPADVLTWSDTAINARVGPAFRNEIGNIRVVGPGWEVASPFAFSVSPVEVIPPPPPPPPPPPLPPVPPPPLPPLPVPGAGLTVHQYYGAVGEPVTIDGQGFGDVPGQAVQEGVPVEVVLWSDTRIVVTSRGSKAPMPSTFTVIRPDGQWFIGQARPVAPGVRR